MKRLRAAYRALRHGAAPEMPDGTYIVTVAGGLRTYITVATLELSMSNGVNLDEYFIADGPFISAYRPGRSGTFSGTTA